MHHHLLRLHVPGHVSMVIWLHWNWITTIKQIALGEDIDWFRPLISDFVCALVPSFVDWVVGWRALTKSRSRGKNWRPVRSISFFVPSCSQIVVVVVCLTRFVYFWLPSNHQRCNGGETNSRDVVTSIWGVRVLLLLLPQQNWSQKEMAHRGIWCIVERRQLVVVEGKDLDPKHDDEEEEEWKSF